jgi:hypothetical protein
MAISIKSLKRGTFVSAMAFATAAGAVNVDDLLSIDQNAQAFTRLIFNNTSQDWSLRNRASGQLSIYDETGSTAPFTILPGAPDNAIFVNGNGQIGLGTSTPGGTFAPRLTIFDPTPDIVLDDGTQKWNLFGNALGSGIFDETNSRLPFNIDTGALSWSLYIQSDGGVGMGAIDPANDNFKDPQAKLHVIVRDEEYNLPFIVENTGPVNFSGFRLKIAPDSWVDFNNSGGNFRINADQVPGAEFQVSPDGNAKLSGVLTQNSDANKKRDVVPVDHEHILQRVMRLPVSEWSYIDSPGVRHIGPMAQDFYQLFSLGDTDRGITSIDTGGVALAAIQGVKKEKDRQIAQLIAEKDAEIDALKKEVALLKSQQNERMLQIEMALAELNAKTNQQLQVGTLER